MLAPYIKTFLMAVFAYLFSLALIRLSGRKTVSQMTFFDFILGVTLGTITANVALGPSRVMAGITLIVFVVLTLIFDTWHIKSFAMRKLLNSEPVVIIQNGKIVEQNLQKARFTLNELNMQLRQNKVFNITDVEYALLETDGKLSVLPKAQKQPLTPSDLGISTSYKGLTTDVIIDGVVMDENLHSVNLDERWLINELDKHGIKASQEVFYAGLDTSGNLYVSKRQVRTEIEGEYGIE